MLIVSGLAVWWLVGAISFSAARVNPAIVDVTSGARKVVRGASWLLVLLFAVSAVNAWLIARRDDGAYDPFDTAPPQYEPERYNDTGYAEFA
jgi:hypothetical protein